MNKVLIVDDNQMTKDSLKALLADSGLPVDSCEGGNIALNIARENQHTVFLIY